MSRQNIFFIVGLFVVFNTSNLLAGNKKKLPNIVIIYADDMGYGDVSYQNKDAKLVTPNIDKLANEGMIFTDAHSSSGICSPSRFALLTGQYHWRRMHDIVWAFGASVFKEDEFTIPRMLKQKGYATACIGKWHLGWEWQFNSEPEQLKYGVTCTPEQLVTDQPIKNGPLAQGFDYYFGDGTINFPPYAFVENDRFVEAPNADLDLTGKKVLEGHWEFRPGPMVKDWNPYDVLPTLTEKVETYIGKQSKDKPFFLYFALPCPHAPIIPNKEFIGKSNAGAYGDFIVQTDDIVGRVEKALKDAGLAENTLVIFSADNGPEVYAYDRVKNTNHRSMGNLRGVKRDTWEGGHRVPFVVKWPGHVKPEMICNETVSQIDIASTISAIVGNKLEDNEAVDSYNLLPLLKNKKHRKPFREATIQNTWDNQYAIRVGDWILIDAPSGQHTRMPAWYGEANGYITYDKSNPGLLYNLKEDPSQKNNLYEQHPERVAEMRELLKQYRESEMTRK